MLLTLPRRRLGLFNWDCYRLADACVVLTEWEAFLMKELYGAPPNKTHVVPNGVEGVFLNSQPAKRGPWLVCTATITERKRVLELAEAAVRAQTPLWIIGKPYSESDAYVQRFVALAKAHPGILRYEGPIQDRARLAQVYREARGFVLLSAMESLSLSALEAAACECPLLLSRLPWATTVFRENACYCPITSSAARTADSCGSSTTPRRASNRRPGRSPGWRWGSSSSASTRGCSALPGKSGGAAARLLRDESAFLVVVHTMVENLGSQLLPCRPGRVPPSPGLHAAKSPGCVQAAFGHRPSPVTPRFAAQAVGPRAWLAIGLEAVVAHHTAH